MEVFFVAVKPSNPFRKVLPERRRGGVGGEEWEWNEKMLRREVGEVAKRRCWRMQKNNMSGSRVESVVSFCLTRPKATVSKAR